MTPEDACLIVFIRSGDEERVLTEIREYLGDPPGLRLEWWEVNDACPDDGFDEDPDATFLLAEQWAAERLGDPGDRRERALMARQPGAEQTWLAEQILDVICPDARRIRLELKERHEAGDDRVIKSSADEFPWLALVPVWERYDYPSEN